MSQHYSYINLKTDVTPATKSCDFDVRKGVARQSRKCDRALHVACLRHGAFLEQSAALFYATLTWNRRCDIGLKKKWLSIIPISLTLCMNVQLVTVAKLILW